MNLFDVYPLFNIEIVKGKGCHVWDTEGNEYLDLYGGHAVISVGHSHPTYVKAITEQVNKLGFYSNSVIMYFYCQFIIIKLTFQAYFAFSSLISMDDTVCYRFRYSSFYIRDFF